MSAEIVGDKTAPEHPLVENGTARADFPAPSRPQNPAHIIQDDREAIAVAQRLAERFAQAASARDRERCLPLPELDEFSQSGLWGITVPKAFGGAEVSYMTVAEVIKLISAADPSLGQIPQNHLAVLEIIRLTGDEQQKRFFFAEVLRGIRFGNAFSESGSKTAGHFDTRIISRGDGFVVSGVQSRPPLAQRADAHLARSGAVEVSRDRELLSEQPQTAPSCLAVGRLELTSTEP